MCVCERAPAGDVRGAAQFCSDRQGAHSVQAACLPPLPPSSPHHCAGRFQAFALHLIPDTYTYPEIPSHLTQVQAAGIPPRLSGRRLATRQHGAHHDRCLPRQGHPGRCELHPYNHERLDDSNRLLRDESDGER